MQLFNRSPKKSEIAKLLEIEDPLSTAKLESSAIARAAFTAMPGILKYSFLFLSPCLGVLLLSLVILAVGLQEKLAHLLLLGAAGLFFSLAAFAAIVIRSSTEKRMICQILEEALDELKIIESHLSSYLETVDKRTSRFFHTITTSKVTTYYILNQLQGELERAVVQVQCVFNRKNGAAISNALRLFQGTLFVSDGLTVEAGHSHEIHFYNIKAILVELEEKMESGIKEIEDEIFSFRNPPTND